MALKHKTRFDKITGEYISTIASEITEVSQKSLVLVTKIISKTERKTFFRVTVNHLGMSDSYEFDDAEDAIKKYNEAY